MKKKFQKKNVYGVQNTPKMASFGFLGWNYPTIYKFFASKL